MSGIESPTISHNKSIKFCKKVQVGNDQEMAQSESALLLYRMHLM